MSQNNHMLAAVAKVAQVANAAIEAVRICSLGSTDYAFAATIYPQGGYEADRNESEDIDVSLSRHSNGFGPPRPPTSGIRRRQDHGSDN